MFYYGQVADTKQTRLKFETLEYSNLQKPINYKTKQTLVDMGTLFHQILESWLYNQGSDIGSTASREIGKFRHRPKKNGL